MDPRAHTAEEEIEFQKKLKEDREKLRSNLLAKKSAQESRDAHERSEARKNHMTAKLKERGMQNVSKT